MFLRGLRVLMVVPSVSASVLPRRAVSPGGAGSGGEPCIDDVGAEVGVVELRLVA